MIPRDPPFPTDAFSRIDEGMEWSSTYQFICFNDDCPYYVRGWSTFENQGIP